MITSLNDQLRRDEGWRAYPYLDSVGKVTIGYGRNLSDVGISPEEGAWMLANDIKAASIAVESYLPWTAALDPIRQAVLINMALNMGIKGLAGFTQMLGKLQSGDYAGAAQEMLNSRWATQVGDRARRLSTQLETGEWQ